MKNNVYQMSANFSVKVQIVHIFDFVDMMSQNYSTDIAA